MTLRRYQHDGLVYYRFVALDGCPEVVHAIFTRKGGASRPPFDSLNLGHTVGDDPAVVAANHSRVYEAVGASPAQVVTAWLVHGCNVTVVGDTDAGRVMPRTDGLVTQTPGLFLFLRFADCLPVLLFDPVKCAIGIGHAGWRGTVAGLAPAVVETLHRAFGSRPADLIATVGPGIGPCCYAVGDDVADAVADAFDQPDRFFVTVRGRRHFDLPAANQVQLVGAGVRHIRVAPICTACRVDEFFSHRAEQRRTGRFGVVIGIRKSAGYDG